MKDPRVYLAHILECVKYISQYTHDGREALLPPLDRLEAEVAGEEEP